MTPKDNTNDSAGIFVRIWKLLQELSSTQGMTKEELAEKLSCNVRTIQRNLQLIVSLGIPLQEKTGLRGKKSYWIEQQADDFTYDEVLAVYVGRRYLEPLHGTQFWDAMQSAYQKMRKRFSPQIIGHLESFLGTLEPTTFGWGKYAQAAETIQELDFAIKEKRQVNLCYRTFDEPKPSVTMVDPYGLAFHENAIYLVGFSHKRQGIRHWKVDRIHDVKLTEITFRVPDDFDLADHIQSMFGIFKESTGLPTHRVRIRFQAYFAQEVQEKHWHSSERFFEQSDGSVILEMDLAELAVLKRWVIGFGRHAEVLEPELLREMVCDELERTIAHYRK